MRITAFVIPAFLIACVALSCKSLSKKQVEEIFPEMMLDVNLPKAQSGTIFQKATKDCSCGTSLSVNEKGTSIVPSGISRFNFCTG
jgi:hypothetical protein